MRKTAIVGILFVIVLIVVFGGLSGSVSKDTSQEDVQTKFEKIEKIQKQTTTSDKFPTQSTIPVQSTIPTQSTPSKGCSGDSRCFTGTVSKIIDGDTIVVDGQSIRFALASTPELNKPIGIAAKEFVKKICPVGSKVKVDEDDGQTQGSYGRIIGVVYCNGVNLNQAVIDEGFGYLFFDKCKDSEFSDDSWSGCNTSEKIVSSQTKYPYTVPSNCDPNYEGACIPLNSPDLDCADVPSGIKVVGSDKHRLDRDGDGIACE